MRFRYEHGLYPLPWMQNDFDDDEKTEGAASAAADSVRYRRLPAVHFVMMGSRSCADDSAAAEKLIDSIGK